MQKKSFLLGVGATVLALLLGALVVVEFGLFPANADAKPSALEAWAAHKSLDATIGRDAPKGPNPVKLSDANLLAGMKLYSQDCATCHGGADGSPSVIARGLYQEAPQLAKDGVEDDPPGETFWKVDHGIRLTAMPSFGHTLKKQQVWQIVLFLKHMDKLPPAVAKAWRQPTVTAAVTP